MTARRIPALFGSFCMVFGGLLSSCQDDSPCEPVEELVRFTAQSGDVLVNSGTIEVGNPGETAVFEMRSTVLNDKGKVIERTLNCCGLGALALEVPNADGIRLTDSTVKVQNVTLINRGIINIHTKELLRRYQDSIQTPEHRDRPYTYLRLLGMYVGTNSMAINEGTINVYFDHDETTLSTVYAMTLIGAEGASLINNGQIHFHGRGSVATRLRGMGTFGSNVSTHNKGQMTADVELCEDARMITTGGDRSNVINDGDMQLRVPGKALCLTRYGNSNLINNGSITMISTDMPEGYSPILGEEDRIACALYEPVQMGRTTAPPMLNRGTISVTLEGHDAYKQGYGMFVDLMGAAADKFEVYLSNEGSITLHQKGAVRFDMAEAGFIARKAAKAGRCNVNLGRWQTGLRDFSATCDLFLARGVKMNYNGARLLLTKPEQYVDGTPYSVAPEHLVHHADHDSLGYRYEYVGYENLVIQSADAVVRLTWNPMCRTAALAVN